MFRVLTILFTLGLLGPVTAVAAPSPREPDRKRDKGCAKNANSVYERKGTVRIVELKDRRNAGICDTRYGRTILVRVDGINRSDAEARVVRIAGDLVVVEGFRTASRAGRNSTYRLVDVRRATDDRLVDRRLVVLFPGGGAAFATKTAPSRLIALGKDGRRDALAVTEPTTRPFTVNGSRVTLGRPSARITVDVAAQAARQRACQPGRAGTEKATFLTAPTTELAVWTLAGVTRACPATPSGELRLPCARRPAFAGARLAVHCPGSPDVVHVVDTTSRATLASHTLGGSALETQLAVSPDGFVAFGTRTDGAVGPLVNVLAVTAADGTAPRTVGQAGHLIRNVRFTVPRTLAWTERQRDGGPAEGKTAAL